VHDVIIVGGGVAGLTAGAFLSVNNHPPVIFETESKCGGLVNSFERDGFIYDGGIRALDNSGILFPMLKQLGLDLEFVKNTITVGIEDQVIGIESEQDLFRYRDLLLSFYPESEEDIRAIVNRMQEIMGYMNLQYSIENPTFLDIKEDLNYFISKVMPWMVKYALISPKINRLNIPVEDYLAQLTDNQALLDIITQHFFTDTPTFFALGYLRVYLDYHYPLGGTGVLTDKLTDLIQRNYGAICTNTRIVEVDPTKKTVTDSEGREYGYRQLIWAADLHSLYQFISPEKLSSEKDRKAFLDRKAELEGKVGNDSVLTLYLGLDLEPSYFSDIASGHFFYSPRKEGESAAGSPPLDSDQGALESWLKEFLTFSTYEISIPALRDPALAPRGKTGLIISLLFDYQLTKRIQDQGWYEEFKLLCQQEILRALDGSIYPGIADKIIHSFMSTPLTLESRTANRHGAITGWSFTNHPLPVENRLMKVFNVIKTPMEDVYQAGQWTYSPSGLPIAILTGKLAADRVLKALK
jgi:phytoene dehydrogenase-like protein